MSVRLRFRNLQLPNVLIVPTRNAREVSIVRSRRGRISFAARSYTGPAGSDRVRVRKSTSLSVARFGNICTYKPTTPIYTTSQPLGNEPITGTCGLTTHNRSEMRSAFYSGVKFLFTLFFVIVIIFQNKPTTSRQSRRSLFPAIAVDCSSARPLSNR